MNTMRLKDGTEVRLPGELIGLDADGNLWASEAPEGEPLTDGDLEGFLGGQAARLGNAMMAQARWVEALATGLPKERVGDPAIRQVADRLVVPPTQVGEAQLRLFVPRGVLAIGPEGDVWRTVGRLLWSPAGGGLELLDYQAAELALVARGRWRDFRDEMVREWMPPMAPRNPPRVPGDHPVA